jgi:hypothetical protein
VKLRRVSGRESDRPRSEEEWKQIKESWKADHADNAKVLKRIQRDYKAGSFKHKKIDEVMRREKTELDVILKIIDILHDSDKILHPSDTTSNSISTSSVQWASGTGQASKFCQFCGSKMPAPALYCPSCGKRQLLE